MGNLSKRDVNLLLVVLGLAIVLLTYFLVFTNFSDQTDALTAETDALRPRLAELQDYVENIPVFEAGILEATERIDAEKLGYVQQVRTEDLIMYAVMLEDEMGVSISSASFSPPVLLYEFDAPDAEGNTVHYQVLKTTMTLNAKFGYEPIKAAINRLYETADKTMLEDLSITFDVETGGLVGNVTIGKVFVTDGTYEYSPTKVPAGPFGNTNPFATITAPPEGEIIEGEEPVEGEAP